MKRWILLILLGMLVAFYGVAKILEGEGEGKKTRLCTTCSICYIFCVVEVSFCNFRYDSYAKKNTRRLFVQRETDERIDDDKTKVNSLIYNKKIYDQGPKNCSNWWRNRTKFCSKRIKNYTDNITAIVTVSDYGEIIPESRRILQTMPLDDIKRKHYLAFG